VRAKRWNRFVLKRGTVIIKRRTFKNTSRTNWFCNGGTLSSVPHYPQVKQNDIIIMDPQTQTDQNKPKHNPGTSQPNSIHINQDLPIQSD
jgi:hypothetical protein